MKKKQFFIFLLLGCLFTGVQAQVHTIILDSTVLEIRVAAEDLVVPWDMVWGPDGNIWFNEKGGTIYRMDPDTWGLDSIHHIEEVYTSPTDNSGFHGLALHPEFPDSPFVYCHYTYDSLAARMTRYTVGLLSDAFVDSVHIIPHMKGARSHNGSRMAWSADQKLFVCFGDAYLFTPAQRNNSILGKILRINYDGSIPSDNPFNNRIWSKGHRNPQGLVFGANGNLYNSEHGPTTDDEINLVIKGGNYGWPNVNGFCDLASEQQFCMDSAVIEPLVAYTPTEAPSGLEYYDHIAIPEWTNSLLQCFLRDQKIQALSLNADGDQVVEQADFLVRQFGRIRDILVAPDGRIFICTSNREVWASTWNAGADKIFEIKNPNYLISVEEDVKDRFSVTLFPSPATDQMRMSFEGYKKGLSVRLRDLMGRELRSVELPAGTHHFMMYREGLASGTYYVSVASSGKKTLMKTVIFQ